MSASVVLDCNQQRMIQLDQGWHACLAPAGSGKTLILTERVSRALAQGIAPQNMICLTFTNAAARSMQDKVKDKLGANPALFIGNIHAFCYRYISQQSHILGGRQLLPEQWQTQLWQQAQQQTLGKLNHPEFHLYLTQALTQLNLPAQQFSPFFAAEQKMMAQALHSSNKKRWHLQKIRSFLLPLCSDIEISHIFKDDIQQRLAAADSQVPSQYVPLAQALAAMTHLYYEKLKTKLQLYDFDDLMIQTLKYWQQHGGAPVYTWCQIDEVQDISPLQWLLLQKIVDGQSSHVMLFGDMQQSIYRFLGASIAVTQHYLPDSMFSLNKNYRSPANLVELTQKYSQHHFPEHSQAVQVHCAEFAKALIHLDCQNQKQLFNAMVKVACRKQNDQYKVVILCPTNAQVLKYSEALQQAGVLHFCVGEKNILQSEAALDFMAFLQVLHQPKDSLAWVQVLQRFGRIQHSPLYQNSSLGAALSSLDVVNQLRALGYDIANLVDHHDVLQYDLRRFVQALKQEKWVYFDTETTGTNADIHQIIQLAAVQLHAQQAIAEMNVYCKTEQDLAETQKIHNISAEMLQQQGQSVDHALIAFMQISKYSSLMAHNMDFDDAMLRSHLQKYQPELYDEYAKKDKFCTLDLTRRLYPHLQSYKLASLLQQFGLSGSNDHNAIHDVKAGVELAGYLLHEAEQRLSQIDDVLSPLLHVLEGFRRDFLPLWRTVMQWRAESKQITLNDLLNLYFSYLEERQLAVFNHAEKLDFIGKIQRHAAVHFNQPAELQAYLAACMPFYRMAKESDLATAHDTLLVSTIHRAKGLEFDCVLLPDLVQQYWPNFAVKESLKHQNPHVRAEAEQEIAQAKRLLYVALTRAKQQLIIGTYQVNDFGHNSPPCEFITPFLPLFERHGAV